MTKGKLKITPLRGRIIVEEDRPAKMIGRIHIPDQHQRKPSVGIVVAIGPETNAYVSIGDRVVYNMYSGTAIFVKGMEKAYRTLVADELLATVEPYVEIEETGA